MRGMSSFDDRSGLVSGEIGFLDNPIAARAADQRADTHKVFEADVTKRKYHIILPIMA